MVQRLQRKLQIQFNEQSVEILQSYYFPYLLLHSCPAVGGAAASTARVSGGGEET